MSIISAFRVLRQVDCHMFEATLSFIFMEFNWLCEGMNSGLGEPRHYCCPSIRILPYHMEKPRLVNPTLKEHRKRLSHWIENTKPDFPVRLCKSILPLWATCWQHKNHLAEPNPNCWSKDSWADTKGVFQDLCMCVVACYTAHNWSNQYCYPIIATVVIDQYCFSILCSSRFHESKSGDIAHMLH